MKHRRFNKPTSLKWRIWWRRTSSCVTVVSVEWLGRFDQRSEKKHLHSPKSNDSIEFRLEFHLPNLSGRWEVSFVVFYFHRYCKIVSISKFFQTAEANVAVLLRHFHFALNQPIVGSILKGILDSWRQSNDNSPSFLGNQDGPLILGENVQVCPRNFANGWVHHIMWQTQWS